MSWERCAPKIGDTASLWNHTAAPGWTPEDVRVLKLGLMKFGMGQWVKILDTGLLPGKLIQQLNGQTQRMVGQQSLGAFTGLRLDVDKLRKDNESRTDVTRKNGMIINTGDALTKKEKEQLRKEAIAKYGLSAEEIAGADSELKATAQERGMVEGRAPAVDTSLLDSTAEDLDRDGRIALLGQLRSLLVEVVKSCERWRLEQAEVGKMGQDEGMPEHIDNKEQIPPEARRAEQQSEDLPCSAAKSQTGGANDMEPSCKPDLDRSCGRLGPLAEVTVSKQRQGTRKRRSAAQTSTGSAMRQAGRKRACLQSEEPYDGSPDGEDSIQAAFEADMDILTSMGYSKRHAKEALEENAHDVQSAANWLMANCS
ncbi:unnamed protein product [Ostreobium quekettii]|uniref:UBA domain-containing protein n=1 Tax=Ostreobium quekettii TaxID=121088 RepID=A0A8S1JGA8_9CHLO|nr:unnamed protein product [Ostreobium quekettii]|eukprot:evm.model.scf_421.9 EVM.evm.TU.scf_421.9   scf_421:66724-74888(-)